MMGNTRQRGVQASRLKLEHYMHLAGIKTQAEIAKRLADREGLESEPKDLVSRIFRQKKVAPHSLERVAHILNVQSHKLYLSVEDGRSYDLGGSAPEHIHVNNAVLLGLAVLAVSLLIWLYTTSDNQLGPIVARTPESINPNVIIYPKNQSLYGLADYMVAHNPTLRLGIVPSILHQSFDLTKMGGTYEADFIIVLEQQIVDRYVVVRIKRLDKQGELQQSSAIILGRNQLPHAYAYISNKAQSIIEVALIDDDDHQELKTPVIKEPDIQNLLAARTLLDRYFDMDVKAQMVTLLKRLDSVRADGLATRCVLEANLAWHGDEKENLARAAGLCKRALLLDDKQPFVLAAYANVLLKNGENKAARRSYEQLIEDYPTHIEGLLGLAALDMHDYTQGGSQASAYLESAIQFSEQAVAQDVTYWRGYHVLTTFYYLSRQMDKALENVSQVVVLAPNQITLGNAVMLNLCHDNLAIANQFSLQLAAHAPNSYIGYETMFFIKAYQQDFVSALASMKQAMAIFEKEGGGLHMQWGQLADAYRWLEQPKLAITNYQRALIEYTQDEIKQQTVPHDQIFSLYYQYGIEPAQSKINIATLVEKIDNMDLRSASTAHLLQAAKLYRWLGKERSAQQLLSKLVDICPVYRRVFDLREL